MLKYKDTTYAKGSALDLAIKEGPEAAKKLYDQTTVNFFKCYGDEAAKGLLALAKGFK